MELPIYFYWILLVCLPHVVTAVDEPTIVCDQTYYVEVGTQAVVSCEYDHSFIAVRWYFDGAEISFLRIDDTSRSGSGIENGEFDIEDDGSMIITEVELKHEGRYTISVLHRSGTASRKEIMVYAMVLLDEVVVTNCRRSSDDLCTKIPSLQRERTLLCVAKDSRPPVEIVWKTTFENEEIISSPSDYSVDMDPFSLLYTSSSYLQYESNLFSLEYFTCQVNGVAAKDVHNASLLLEGEGDFTQHTENIQYVLKGSSFEFPCPPNSFQFALLKVTYSSGIENLLVTSHPSNEGRQCLEDAKCHVQGDGLITIENIAFEDEGSYECAYGNGIDSYMHVLMLKVMVQPSPFMTVIEGCIHKEHCRISAFSFGTLTCSLFESRPAVNLSFEVAEASRNDISISNVENDVVAGGVGTYNTMLTVEYKIKRCGNPIEITCKAETTVHSRIKFSKAYLVTEDLHCKDVKENATLIILAVLFTVVILSVVIVLVVFVVKRKKGVSKTKTKSQDQEIRKLEDPKESEEKEERKSLLTDEEKSEQLSLQLQNVKKKRQDEENRTAEDDKDSDVNEEKKSLLAEEEKSEQFQDKKEAEKATIIEDQTTDRKEHKGISTGKDTPNAANKEKVELDNLEQSPQDDSKTQKEEKVNNSAVVVKHNYREEVKPQEVEAEKAKTIDVPHNYREEGRHQDPEAPKVETASANGEDKPPKIEDVKNETKSEEIKTEDKPQMEKELTNDAITGEHNYPEEVKPQAVEAEKAKTTGVPILTGEDKHPGKQDVSKEKKSEEISEETHKPAVKDGGETQTNAGKMEKDKLQVHETEKNRTNLLKQSSQLGDKCEGEEAKTNNQKSGVKKQYSQREDSHEGKDEAQNKTSDTKKNNSETVEDILKRFEQNTHQPVQNILKYVKFSTVEDTSDTKILYIYFLQVCYRRYHGSTKNSRFREIFCAILQKVMADQEEKQRDEPEGEKLTGIFLRVLLCSVERKTIDIDTCMKILLEEMDHNTIQREEYYHAIKNCLQESLLSTKTLTDILFASLENDLITKENFATTLKSQRKAEQMTQEDFLIALKFAVKNKQLSTSKFTNILSESLSKDLISQPTFLTALESLFTTKQISKDIFQSTLFGKLQEKQIPAELFVSNMHSLLAKGQIECMIFVDLLKCSVNDNLVPSEMFTNILYQTLQEKLIREETFISTLKALLTKNKIGFVLFMDLLERSLNDKLISDKRFENQFKTYLQEGDWNKNRWIQLLIRLLTKHTIKDDLKLQLLKLVTVKYKMSEQDSKNVLQSCKMKAEEIKAFMSDLDL